MPETYTHNGVLYDVEPPLFPYSINKCTGCALQATRHNGQCPRHVCIGSLNDNFTDRILTNPRNPHGN